MVALVFLGLSWNVNNLAGDVFLNFFLTSIAEIVGFILCIPLLNRVGRKPVYVVSLLTGGVALLLTMVPVLLGSSGSKFHQHRNIDENLQRVFLFLFILNSKQYIHFETQSITCNWWVFFVQIHNG